MKSSGLLFVPVITVALACGGSSSGGGGATGATAITTAAQATNASAASSQATSLAANSGTSLANLAQVTAQLGGAARFRSPVADQDARHVALHAAQKKAIALQGAKLAAGLQKARSLATAERAQAPVSGSSACADGGSVSYSGTLDGSTGAFDVEMTYSSCRQDDEEMSGTVSATGTYSATGSDAFTMTEGDGDGTVEDTDFSVMLFTAGYVDVYARYRADVTVSATGSCSDQACSSFSTTLTANGKEQYSDFIDEYTFTYSNLRIVGSDASTATGYTSTYTTDGGVSESWSGGGVGLTFDHLALGFSTTASYYEETADGGLKVDFTPDDYCFGGTFTIDTQVPVRSSYATGLTTAGRVVINDNVTVEYAADGSVTVTVTGQAPSQYASADALESVCAIQDMKPGDSTATTVDPGAGATATGSTLLATLTWTGGDTSDMDLHLAHYAEAAPTSASTADWHVYYAAMEDGGFAVLDIDDTEGYGPEHITMTTLPTGYYSLYVDPYSMDSDPSATVTVTLKIGNDTFQFPTHTFTSSSEDVFRVCDLRVDAGGSVAILAPDSSLSAWAPALRAVKVR